MDSKYTTLNDKQQEAVFHTEGPLLILAGAGSGKTRVLTHRVAYLIEEKNVAPWNILAITFTNKAAEEMKERVSAIINAGGHQVWVSTFHSTCVRILRRHIDLIGYDKSFVIYDTDDSKAILKECYKLLNIDDKLFNPRSVLSEISNAKNELISPKKYNESTFGDYRKEQIGKIYSAYQKKLESNNALDFDDIIMKMVELFRLRPEVLDHYQERFKYIMVDEYQDTNTAQYKFISLLAAKYRNLCVVGDDDQSIYKFRGANIRNILDFEKEFKDAHVIKLEQNYRCTKTILETANYVIKNNIGRKDKTLWTAKEQGKPVNLYSSINEHEEADYITSQIINQIENEAKEYNQIAILYRTNAQSRVLEEKCLMKNIPYRLYGGLPFYQRKEIKDILSYLRIINNSKDDLAVKRIINVPKRGIGNTTVGKVDNFALMEETDFFAIIKKADEYHDLKRAAKKLIAFSNTISVLKVELGTMSLVEFMDTLLKRIGYIDYLRKEYGEEVEPRIDNINELISKVAEYEENTENPSLDEFLEEVSLVAAIDNYEEGSNAITMMTLHSAKGLEFPIVFLAGLEDGLFPSYMSIMSDDESDIEEERRLCYVGITRAKEDLYITWSKSRMVRGNTQFNRRSRFIEEIPEELLEEKDSYNKIQNTLNKSYKPRNSYINKVKKEMPLSKDIKCEYKVGDLVSHKKFGMGTVQTVEPGGADMQVTVMFTKVGIKKLLATLSGLKKVEL